jgi:hypothetical protein
MPQRQADLAVLMSVYARSTSGNPLSTKLLRVRNSLTAGGYLTAAQFAGAMDTLQRLQMVELEESGDEPRVVSTAYGSKWLMANFHWVQGDRATLEPNDDNWVMTPPEPRSHVNAIAGVKDS